MLSCFNWSQTHNTSASAESTRKQTRKRQLRDRKALLSIFEYEHAQPYWIEEPLFTTEGLTVMREAGCKAE